MREARRLCAVTEARLQTLQAQQGEATSQAARLSGACKAGSAEGAEPQGRPAAAAAAAAGSHNLSHLRQVVERYIMMDDGEETDALFQVLGYSHAMHLLCHAHMLCDRDVCTQCVQYVCKKVAIALQMHTQSTHTQRTHTPHAHCACAAIHQVIATFLQFDAATVRELQAARQRKGAAQRGLIGRASLLFSQR